MRNKLLLSLVFAAASSSVFAMPYEPMDHCGILEVALTGGGFKATADASAYGLAPASGSTVGGDVLKNDPKYKFGGTVLLGYYFPNSTINVDASYTGTRNRTSDSHSGTIDGLGIPDDNYLIARFADSDHHFDYDFVNIEVGSLTRVNCNGLIINPQLGLSYARLKDHQTIGYAGSGIRPEVLGVTLDRHSKFNGFGPSFNLDLNFVVCRPINLFGNFRYNALVGNIHAHHNISDVAGVATRDVSVESKNTLVSLFQSELGIGYDFNFCNMFCGNFAIGYQLTKAIAPGERFGYTDSSSELFTDNLFNENIHGYFARLTMDFNV